MRVFVILVSLGLMAMCSSVSGFSHTDLLRGVANRVATLSRTSATRFRRATNTACDLETLGTRLSKCLVIPDTLSTKDLPGIEAFVEETCKNSECLLECFFDTVGGCLTTPEISAIVDKEMITVAARSLCDNRHQLENIFTSCQTTDIDSCIENNVSNITKDIGTDTIETLCSTVGTLRSCFDVTPDGEQCTASNVAVAKGIVDVVTSFPACDYPRNHAFYTRYGGDLTCGAGHAIVTSFQLVAMVILAVVMVW